MTKIERYISERLNLSIAMKLTTIVRSDALVAVIVPANEADHRSICFLNCHCRDLSNFNIATHTLYKCDDRVATTPMDRINLPMTELATGFNMLWTFFNRAFAIPLA